MDNSLNFLADRPGFNRALRHFKKVTQIVRTISDGGNLADVINGGLEDGSIDSTQVKSIVNAVLVDKFAYHVVPHNALATIKTVGEMPEVLDGWGKIDLVLVYHDPNSGMQVINPKAGVAWEALLPINKGEYIVLHLGQVAEEVPQAILEAAGEDFYKMLYGEIVESRSEYKGVVKRSGAPAAKPVPAPKAPPVAAGAKRRVTPQYQVQVTNELFHNGNVEAWKKIVLSYTTEYPTSDVMIWYDGERIHDINALFKWGKVKSGTSILFSVAGDEIQDVAKLRRYLFEGASPRFEVFLQGGVDRVLDLF